MNFKKLGRKSKLIKLYKIIAKNHEMFVFLSFAICATLIFVDCFFMIDDPTKRILNIVLMLLVATLLVVIIFSLPNELQNKEEKIKKIESENLNAIKHRLTSGD